MKLTASFLILLALTLSLAAQNISVASFTLDEKDLTANLSGTIVEDQNGQKCALLRIQTTEKGFTFDVGVLKIAFPIRKICWTDKFFIPSHQQNPPRFSLDQRTRAGLLLYMSTIRRVSGTCPCDPQSERGTPPLHVGMCLARCLYRV